MTRRTWKFQKTYDWDDKHQTDWEEREWYEMVEEDGTPTGARRSPGRAAPQRPRHDGMSGYSEGGAEVGRRGGGSCPGGTSGGAQFNCGLLRSRWERFAGFRWYRRRHRGTWASLHICAASQISLRSFQVGVALVEVLVSRAHFCLAS